jgi:hypothetical protein
MAFLDIFMDKVISHLIDISGEGGLIDPTTMLKRLGTQHPETQPQIDNFRHITEDLTDAGDLLNDQEFMQKIKDDNMAGAAIICRMYEHGTSRPLDAPPDDKEPKPFPVVLSVDKVEYVMRGARRILIMAMKIEAPAGLGRDKDSATQARILKTFMSEVTMADLKPHIPENIASKIDLPMLCILKVYCDLPSADDAEEEPKED